MTEIFTGEIPGLEIDLAKVLHGEQYFKILKPLPHEAKLTNTFKIQVNMEQGAFNILKIFLHFRMFWTKEKEWFC